MLSPGSLAPYVGFTENEVRKLAEEYHQDFDEVKRWYDGYLLNGHQVYNPRAVVGVMLRGEFKSYWSETASYDADYFVFTGKSRQTYLNGHAYVCS